MIERNHITGIILAGGKSSRMGTEKGFVQLEGITFMERIIGALNPLANQILMVTDNADYDVFKHPRIEDIIKNSGPLAGLYTGLCHSKTEYNLVLSCDVPFINAQALRKLINEMEDGIDVVQFKSQNRTIPLVAIYRKHCINICLELLKKGEKRLLVALNHLKVKTIVVDSGMEIHLKNINTKDQLKKLQNAVEH